MRPGRIETLFLIALAMVVGDAAAEDDGMDPWRIEAGETSREYIVSNGERTHFATDTRLRNQRSYHGLYTSMHKSLSELRFQVDGAALDPERAVSVSAWPWLLRREFEGGLSEETLLPRGEDDLLLVRWSVEGVKPERWELRPWVDWRWIWETPRAELEIHETGGGVAVARRGWQPGPGVPRWLGIATSADADWKIEARRQTLRHPRDEARQAMGTSTPTEIGVATGAWPRGVDHVDVAVALADDPETAVAKAAAAVEQRDWLLARKREHVLAISSPGAVITGDDRLDRAYGWARASMDVLLMNVRGRGIYAGYHWFPNYWGRDSFICLPGACLVTGRLDDARAILRSFLPYQLVDRSSERMGRLPNIVNPGELQYEGVDGTWWFVRAAHRYLLAAEEAGAPDAEFEAEFRAALALMIDGAERAPVDEHGLLRHHDGETWMDAGGIRRPESPRGDRAVEVQALYYNALRVAQWLAERAEDEAETTRLGALAERTLTSFRAFFWDEEREFLADHVNADDSRDEQLRPNVILALTAVHPDFGPFLPAADAKRVVDRVYGHLVLAWGVTSLDPSDPQFHPQHLALDRYPFDEAYHNGDVWLWLSGPMITALVQVGRVDEARAMLDPLVDDLLDHGAVGSLREIRDGGAAGNLEEFGGATFQAWSLAEFLRAIHEDLAPALGWKMEAPRQR